MVDAMYREIELIWKESKPCQIIKQRIEKAEKRPLFLYGAGRLTGVFIEACGEMGISISGICDSYMQGKYKEFIIINPEELYQKYSDAVILICSYSYNNEIYTRLREQGYAEEQIIPAPLDIHISHHQRNFFHI